jgi:succinyl-diaminopimelate desuccinylase
MQLHFLAALLLAQAQAPNLAQQYDAHLASRLPVMLSELLRFQTVAGNAAALREQQAWLARTGKALGFVVRDAGRVTEIELPGPPGAPVLGLVTHGDVQPVDEHWTIPPFNGLVKDGKVFGRGAADDKGPIVQALLAMKTLADSGVTRTHTVRLLVGTDEESENLDIVEYLKLHRAPDYSLVLDSEFPVVVGEKAWNSLTVACVLKERGATAKPWTVEALEAGLSPSIVPDWAHIRLGWRDGKADWSDLKKRLHQKTWGPGLKWDFTGTESAADIVIHGHAAHAGVNLRGGRNALVGLANVLEGELNGGCADDLLAFARVAGQDLHGTGLGLTKSDPVWGRWSVNVATVKPKSPDLTELTVNLRSTPPMNGPAREAYLRKFVSDFSEKRGVKLEVGGFFKDEPLRFDPQAKLVRRLLADYAKAAGRTEGPAISGGGTYAKRLPSSIAFGMWFAGTPYPGHDVDEAVSIQDEHRGVHVLLEALGDLATGPALASPFSP